MKLPDKYKGKSFADISKSIQEKYKDRHDPISKRGMNAELEALKKEQEAIKTRQAIQEGIQKVYTAAEEFTKGGPFNPTSPTVPSTPRYELLNYLPVDQRYGEMNPTNFVTYNMLDNVPNTVGGGYPIQDYAGVFGQVDNFKPEGFNVGSAIDPLTNKTKNSNEVAVFDVNTDALAQDAGIINYSTPQTMAAPDTSSTQKESSFSLEGAGKYAPFAMNIASIMSMRKPEDIYDTLKKKGVGTSLGYSKFTRPTRQHYSNVDFSPIEKGIEEQGRAFTEANRNATAGNSGAFMANEQASRANIMQAIAQARMQEQQMNNQVTGMNAAEQARYEQMMMAQAQANQGVDQYNIGLGMQLEDINARNIGAYNTAKSQQMNQLAMNMQSLNKENQIAEGILNALGYGTTGEYGQNKEDLLARLSMLLKLSGKTGV